MQLKNVTIYPLVLLLFVLISCTGNQYIVASNIDNPSVSQSQLQKYYLSQPEFSGVSVSNSAKEIDDQFSVFFNDRMDSAFFAPFLDSMRLKYPTEWEYVDHLVRFVQEDITYKKQGSDTDIQYPFETFTRGAGICSDQTVLLAKLLIYSGYNVALFAFTEAEHIGVGLKVPEGYGSFNSPYVYIETTNVRPVGNVPSESFEDQELKNPQLVNIESAGERSFTSIGFLLNYYDITTEKYGVDFVFLDQKSRFLIVRINSLQQVVDSMCVVIDEMQISYDQLSDEMEATYKEMHKNGCNTTVLDQEQFEKCELLANKYNWMVENSNILSAEIEKKAKITNSLVNELNKLVAEYNDHISIKNKP